MKKFLTLSILSLSILASASFANAQTMTSTTTRTTTTTTRARPMMQNRRVVTRTRTVRVGGRVYRETVQTRFANGRSVTRVVSRVRVR